jgi:hypothetical protein
MPDNRVRWAKTLILHPCDCGQVRCDLWLKMLVVSVRAPGRCWNVQSLKSFYPMRYVNAAFWDRRRDSLFIIVSRLRARQTRNCWSWTVGGAGDLSVRRCVQTGNDVGTITTALVLCLLWFLYIISVLPPWSLLRILQTPKPKSRTNAAEPYARSSQIIIQRMYISSFMPRPF